MNFPGGSVVKNSPDHTGDPSLIPGSGGFPAGGNDNPLQYFYQESHGQRNLVGYCPWGGKELDATERLSTYISKNRSNLSGLK